VFGVGLGLDGLVEEVELGKLVFFCLGDVVLDVFCEVWEVEVFEVFGELVVGEFIGHCLFL
jgi:hypothetical protein